jgi:hypothetical protein
MIETQTGGQRPTERGTESQMGIQIQRERTETQRWGAREPEMGGQRARERDREPNRGTESQRGEQRPREGRIKVHPKGRGTETQR